MSESLSIENCCQLLSLFSPVLRQFYLRVKPTYFNFYYQPSTSILTNLILLWKLENKVFLSVQYIKKIKKVKNVFK